MYSVIYSRAPVRLGLIGGGTDLDEFCNTYTGHIINCSISLYNHVNLTISKSEKLHLEMHNFNSNDKLVIDDLDYSDVPKNLIFITAAFKYFKRNYNIDINVNINITLESDVFSGSGLGGSSSMMVAIVGALNSAYSLELSKHEVARHAYNIERIDLKIFGGSQDFYASTFGGINHMHFMKNGVVLVNKVDIDDNFSFELESSILMYYTGIRRESKIIEIEKKELLSDSRRLDNMLELATIARKSVKYLTEKKSVAKFGREVGKSWELKKKTSSKVTSEIIDMIYMTGKAYEVYGGKISGAGSGGYGFFIMKTEKRNKLKKILKEELNIESMYINLDKQGLKVTSYEHN